MTAQTDCSILDCKLQAGDEKQSETPTSMIQTQPLLFLAHSPRLHEKPRQVCARATPTFCLFRVDVAADGKASSAG